MIVPLDYSATATWILWGEDTIFDKFSDPAHDEIQAFNLSTRKARTLFTLPERLLSHGLALTQDGNSILFTQLDRADSSVIIADYEYVHLAVAPSLRVTSWHLHPGPVVVVVEPVL